MVLRGADGKATESPDRGSQEQGHHDMRSLTSVPHESSHCPPPSPLPPTDLHCPHCPPLSSLPPTVPHCSHCPPLTSTVLIFPHCPPLSPTVPHCPPTVPHCPPTTVTAPLGWPLHRRVAPPPVCSMWTVPWVHPSVALGCQDLVSGSVLSHADSRKDSAAVSAPAHLEPYVSGACPWH